MKIKDMGTIQRALGLIEGVAYGVGEVFATPLIDAVEMIESAIEKEGAD